MGISEQDALAKITRIEELLRRARISVCARQELEIHDALARAFEEGGIRPIREFSFAPRCRADLWVEGIVIEVKRRRPPKELLITQLDRYTKINSVLGVLVVLERSILLPRAINQKPVRVMSLNALWGVAL